MLYAFGDIHGRLDLLNVALATIEARDPDGQRLFLGDYVDRGPESKAVVERIMALHAAGDICLKGNHEQMMVDSWRIASYGALSKMWVSNGGKQTLQSYDAGYNAYNAKWDMIPQEHIDWMDKLPAFHDTPGRIFVHAGLIPGVRLEAHDEEEMMWIRDRFLLGRPQDFEKHVVHGHTHTAPVIKTDPTVPELLSHRTNLDTGAFFTGILTIGVFDPEGDGGPERLLRIHGPPVNDGEPCVAYWSDVQRG